MPKKDEADAMRPPRELPHDRSVELHCVSPIEQPQDDANSNQANKTAIAKLLDNIDQITHDIGKEGDI